MKNSASDADPDQHPFGGSGHEYNFISSPLKKYLKNNWKNPDPADMDPRIRILQSFKNL